MRIVQLISHYLPAVRFGGPQQVAHGLGRALVDDGHEVAVCTTNLKDEHHDLDVPLDTPVDVDGVDVYYFATKWSRYWGYAPGMWRRAEKLISEADAVFVHFHYQYANHVGATLARKAGTPFILFSHGSFKYSAMRRRNRWLKSGYLAMMETRNLSAARCIVFNAEEEQRLSRMSERGIVIPNAIAPSDFTPMPAKGQLRERLGLSNEQLLFLFLGRIDFEGKGLDLLLEAIANRPADSPDTRYVFAGPDERGGLDKFKARIKELRLEDKVSIVGMLTGDDKLSALADADAFLLPSRSEGLSIALLEALHLGVPVLITDQVGLHQQVVAHNAGCVVEVNSKAIGEGLRRLENHQERTMMRGNATSWIATDHTWESVAKQVLPLVAKAEEVAT